MEAFSIRRPEVPGRTFSRTFCPDRPEPYGTVPEIAAEFGGPDRLRTAVSQL